MGCSLGPRHWAGCFCHGWLQEANCCDNIYLCVYIYICIPMYIYIYIHMYVYNMYIGFKYHSFESTLIPGIFHEFPASSVRITIVTAEKLRKGNPEKNSLHVKCCDYPTHFKHISYDSIHTCVYTYIYIYIYHLYIMYIYIRISCIYIYIYIRISCIYIYIYHVFIYIHVSIMS